LDEIDVWSKGDELDIEDTVFFFFSGEIMCPDAPA